jgi:hypothetical protein
MGLLTTEPRRCGVIKTDYFDHRKRSGVTNDRSENKSNSESYVSDLANADRNAVGSLLNYQAISAY